MEKPTAEQIVKASYPDACLVHHGHGKYQAWSPNAGYLGDIAYLGLLSKRLRDAWESAAARIETQKGEKCG